MLKPRVFTNQQLNRIRTFIHTAIADTRRFWDIYTIRINRLNNVLYTPTTSQPIN